VGDVVSLLPLARRLAAAKARDKAAGAASSAPAEGAAPMPDGPASAPASPGAAVPDAGELDASVAEAQAMLAQAAASKAMRHDPYRHILTGLSDTIGVLPTMVRRWEQAVKDVIAARHPLTQEERTDLARAVVEATKEGAYEGTRKEAARMIRRLDHTVAVRMGLYVGAAFVAGCVLTVGALAYYTGGPFQPDVEAGGAWRELVQLNPDPRPLLAAGEVRTDRATGRRYHAGVSLWMDPSPPPPGAPVKAKGGQ
jgi:hypothetical protein